MQLIAQKQRHPRQRRRLRVVLGTLPLFTSDVSPGGFCAEMMRVPVPGTTVDGTIRVGHRELPFRGIVAWIRPGDSRVMIRGRVGVHFTEIPDDFVRELESMYGRAR